MTSKDIVTAIQLGEYTVDYEEPNCVSVYVDWRGRDFLVASRSSRSFRASYGLCMVTVLDEEFYWDFEIGKWRPNPWLAYRSVVDALYQINDLKQELGGDLAGLKQAYLLASRKKYNPDIPIYWEDDPLCPENADEFIQIDSSTQSWHLDGLDWSDQQWEKKLGYHLCEKPRRSRLGDGLWKCRAVKDGERYIADGGFYRCVELLLANSTSRREFKLCHRDEHDEEGDSEPIYAKIVKVNESRYGFSPTHGMFMTLAQLAGNEKAYLQVKASKSESGSAQSQERRGVADAKLIQDVFAGNFIGYDQLTFDERLMIAEQLVTCLELRKKNVQRSDLVNFLKCITRNGDVSDFSPVCKRFVLCCLLVGEKRLALDCLNAQSASANKYGYFLDVKDSELNVSLRYELQAPVRVRDLVSALPREACTVQMNDGDLLEWVNAFGPIFDYFLTHYAFLYGKGWMEQLMPGLTANVTAITDLQCQNVARLGNRTPPLPNVTAFKEYVAATLNFIKDLKRISELKLGIPDIEEEWKASTEFYFKVVEAFPLGSIRVVHRYRAPWTQPGFLDVFFPTYNLGVLYRGKTMNRERQESNPTVKAYCQWQDRLIQRAKAKYGTKVYLYCEGQSFESLIADLRIVMNVNSGA